MLPRTPDSRPVQCHAHRRWPVQPVRRHMVRWLKGTGSLTQRLRQFGTVTVAVQYQGTRRLWRAEQQALGQRCGHVREVVLLVDGQAMVWARSVTSLRAMRGPWRALKGLGSRPLAELLFSHARVQRGPLQLHHWRAHGPERARAHRQWSHQTHVPSERPATARPSPPRWARASVFRHQGQALRVLESFSPQVQGHFTP